MLGKYVVVRVTKPMHSFDAENGISNELNFGKVESGIDPKSPVKGAYIMGVNHRVRLFEGRVIAVIKRKDMSGIYLVVTPKSKRFIVHAIEDAVSYAEKSGTYELSCLYESSCGAVVYRIINGEVRFLLIKNKRSLNWGFPKGHMELGEDELETDVNGRLPEPNERCTLGVVDLQDGNTFIPVTTTACWNFQEAAMAFWMDNDTILFNDVRDITPAE